MLRSTPEPERRSVTESYTGVTAIMSSVISVLGLVGMRDGDGREAFFAQVRCYFGFARSLARLRFEESVPIPQALVASGPPPNLVGARCARPSN